MLWHGTHLPLVERDHVLDLHLDDVVDPLVEGGEADAGQDVQQQHRHHHRHRRVPVRQPQADNENRCDCERLSVQNINFDLLLRKAYLAMANLQKFFNFPYSSVRVHVAIIISSDQLVENIFI